MESPSIVISTKDNNDAHRKTFDDSDGDIIIRSSDERYQIDMIINELE